MSALSIIPFRNELFHEFDCFVDSSINGTFLHTQRFLSYHDDKFDDQSLLITQNNKLVAVFPAALDPDCETKVVSHPGSSFGGLIYTGKSYGNKIVDIFAMITDHYAQNNIKTLIYKKTPHIYFRTPVDDDGYALLRHGATLFRRDISATINLHERLKVSSLRKRSTKKALQEGVLIDVGFDVVEEYWQVLNDNLKQAHHVSPVHTVEEIMRLKQRLGSAIELLTAKKDGVLVAGVLLFNNWPVSHAQYIASSLEGRDIGALDLVFEACIERTEAENYRYFDFGISTEKEGKYLNESLYQYKRQFGAGSVCHDFYRIDL